MDGWDDDDDDAFVLANVDVDAVARRALASRANDGDANDAVRTRKSMGDKNAIAVRRGGDLSGRKENLDDVPLRARAEFVKSRDEAKKTGDGGQLTVTSMFAAAVGTRAAPTTVMGEIQERVESGARASAANQGAPTGEDRGGWKRKRPEQERGKRKHQGTLPKELMIRKSNDAKELEALRTNLPPDALGARDAAGLTMCPTAGGPEGLPMDPEAIQTYVYPAQIARREYQYEITRNALLTNSLVCLPTGLGKTLIAAVVMFNYYRWFPTGKIIFMAPTRPLVDQQMAACHGMLGIPREDTVVLMGTTKKDESGSRRDFWQQKRVFFCTPHTVHNDLENGDLDANQVVCVVVDEAHHARGQYASAEVLRVLTEQKVRFRLLALTATPGQGLEEVQAVVKTLRIGRIDFRSDQDPDVSRYTHKREMIVEKVKPDQAMSHVQDMLCDLLRPYCAKLASMGALGENSYRMQQFINNRATHGASRIEPPAWFTLHSARRDLSHNQNVRAKGSAYAMLEAAMELSKAYDLLLKLGAKDAYEYCERRGAEKQSTLIHRTDQVSREVVDLLRSMSCNGAHHSPKLDRLTSILKHHFKESTADTRVIIFTSYRTSVKDIVRALRDVPAGADTACKIKVAEFVGQGDTAAGKKRGGVGGAGGDDRGTKGQTQKEQKQTLVDFRAGTLNTLVATSIGEEGLDIPSVDLIVFFDVVDIIRAIQRMGRTGRARDGKVVILATEGKEFSKYTSEQKKYETLMCCLRVPGNHFQLDKNCPRIVPEGVTPVCQLMMIDPSPAEKRTKSKIKRDEKTKKPRGIKAILNAAKKLKDAPLDPASRAILYAYEYEGNALSELDLTSATIFLSRPDPVYAVEHSQLSRAFIGVMADLQGMARVDPAGVALPGGPCASRRAQGLVQTAGPEPAADHQRPTQIPDDGDAPGAADAVFGDEDFADDWQNDWHNFPETSQDGPMYDAVIKTSQEVREELTQMSDPVPRRISMHSVTPKKRSPFKEARYSPGVLTTDEETLAARLEKRRANDVTFANKSTPSDAGIRDEEGRTIRDRASMPPPPPRMTPQSDGKASATTPSTDGELNFKRHVSKVGRRVLMSQEISPIVGDGCRPSNGTFCDVDDNEIQIVDDEEDYGGDDPIRTRRPQRARALPIFNLQKRRNRRNNFIDDEAEASDEDDDGEGELSSGDEAFIANTQMDDAANHPGAHFDDATPEDPPRDNHARRDVMSRMQLEHTFAVFGPRERRAVQDTPSPTQQRSEGNRSMSKYDSSFIDDGSDDSPEAEDSVKRPVRCPMRDVDEDIIDEPAAQPTDEMWDTFDDHIEEWGDDGWGGASQHASGADGGRDHAVAGDDDDDW